MDKTNALSLTGGGMFDGGWTPVWLIKDDFTDTVAAGSVNGTAATPGPGTRVVTDTESKFSVGAGVLAAAGGKASPAWGDPGLYYDEQVRAAGLLALTRVSVSDATKYSGFGWDENTTSSVTGGAFNLRGADAGKFRITEGSLAVVVDSFSIDTNYNLAAILLSIGSMYIVKGGAFANWTLLYAPFRSVSTSSMFPVAASYNQLASADYLRVIQLPAPFDTDDGLATDTHSGSVAAGTTFTHEADCLLEFTVTTLPTAANGIRVKIRAQDADNYWLVYINQTGGLYLYESVAGGLTVRGTAVTVVSNGHRVVVIAEGTTINGYSNNVLRWTYSSASNFSSRTSGELNAVTGGVVSDVKTWPRTLSGTAASILNKASG